MTHGADGGASRWAILDSLRGFAIVGIIFVNGFDIVMPDAATSSGEGDSIRGIFDVLIQTRFVPIFTFLFGMSLWLVIAGAKERPRGRRPWAVALRRLVALFAIGTLLGVIYGGNVLPDYALYGLLTLPLILFAPRRVVLVVGVVLGVAAQIVTGGGNESVTVGLILVGAASAAYGMPRLMETADRRITIVFCIAAAATVPALWLQATTPGDPRFTAWGAHAGLIMAVLYVSAFSLLWRTRARAWIARTFAPLGRMALTNYVGTALALAGVAQIWDRSGGSDLWVLVVICCAIIVCQWALSRLWLERFEYGPIEWLWRMATWLRPVPMRLAPASSASRVR